MKRSTKPPAAKEADEVSKAELSKAEISRGRIIERPDGFYWQSSGSGDESGPFVTLAEAEADMLSGEQGEAGDPEALHQAESELGISEWIDPDSGVPAEDFVPRLEDH